MEAADSNSLDEHPFVRWWMEESGYYTSCTDWRASLVSPQGRAAIAAWNAALRDVDERNTGHVEGIDFMPDEVDIG